MRPRSDSPTKAHVRQAVVVGTPRRRPGQIAFGGVFAFEVRIRRALLVGPRGGTRETPPRISDGSGTAPASRHDAQASILARLAALP